MLARALPEPVIDVTPPEAPDSDLDEVGGEDGAGDSMAGFDSEQGLRALRLSMVPPFLDWGPSELCRPVLSSVDIVNLSPDEPISVKSVSTDDDQFFYGSDDEFETVTVEPQGNVSVPFLFVPQTLGLVQSSVYVSTSAVRPRTPFHSPRTAPSDPSSGLPGVSDWAVRQARVSY
eukprot:SAG11_NODE_96_length_17016_cov_18.755113_1_plen_175_part_00